MGHHQDLAGHRGPVLGMPAIDDHPAVGIDPAPEAERLGEAEHRPGRRTVQQWLGGDDAHHEPVPVTIRPATADSTHSAAVPNTTSMPKLPGA